MATMNLTLKVWRQKNSQEKGRMVEYKVNNISDHMSFLEMLDILNEQLIGLQKKTKSKFQISFKQEP